MQAGCSAQEMLREIPRSPETDALAARWAWGGLPVAAGMLIGQSRRPAEKLDQQCELP